MIKTIGLLQRRVGLDPAGFRAHYEEQHAPLATELLGFPGYQRNYPASRDAREGLGLDALSEFWFTDAGEITRIAGLMQGEAGTRLLEDEPRFMNVPANQTWEVAERLYGERPAPGDAARAVAIQRLPRFARAGERERALDHRADRKHERRLPGVLAALYSVPLRASMPIAPGQPGVGVIESLWLVDEGVLEACNRWREDEGAPPLWIVEESGTPVAGEPPALEVPAIV